MRPQLLIRLKRLAPLTDLMECVKTLLSNDLRRHRGALGRAAVGDPDFSPKVAAYRWVARITTVSIEMCVPGLLGYFVDRAIGFLGPFTMIGFALGLVIGIWQLVRMSASPNDKRDVE